MDEVTAIHGDYLEPRADFRLHVLTSIVIRPIQLQSERTAYYGKQRDLGQQPMRILMQRQSEQNNVFNEKLLAQSADNCACAIEHRAS